MRRTGIWFIIATFVGSLALSACIFNGEEDANSDDECSDTGVSTAEDSGNSSGDENGMTAADGYSDSASDDDSSSTSDTGETNGSGADTSDSGNDSGGGGTYEDTSSQEAFVTRHSLPNGGNDCRGLTADARIQVGPADDAFTQLTGALTDEGHTEIEKGGWVKWVWKSGSGSHTVTGDKSDTFTDDDKEALETACGEADTAWFDSGVQGATEEEETEMYCVKFNEVGEYYYQCTVGQHCEKGMWGRVDVVKKQ